MGRACVQSPIAPSRASEADLKIMPIMAIIASLPFGNFRIQPPS
jgi:hypothetical protein